MNSLKLALLITLTFLFTTMSVLTNPEVANATSLGEKLLSQLWVDMQKPDMERIEKTTAKGFQSVHQYGSSTREQQIELIKTLNFGEYTLSDVEITRNGPVIVATYLVSVEETIKGKQLSKKPAPRLSVFLKTDSGWQWIAHANLKHLK